MRNCNTGCKVLVVICILILLQLFGCAGDIMAPVVVHPCPQSEASVVRLPDGTMKVFYIVKDKRIESLSSTDNGLTWGPPQTEFELPGPGHLACVVMLDRDNELHAFFQKWRGEGEIAVTRFLDIWHCKTSSQRKSWTPPQRIIKGFVGSIRNAVQLSNHRIVIPYPYWVAGRECAPPVGCNICTSSYSDDGGLTWKRSPVELTSPCYEGFSGSNYGADEPVVIELKDSRVWMLMRTQTGFLYESFSPDGVNWSQAQPSRFYSSSSPAALLRLTNDKIILFWNNCESPPRVDGQSVYVGRDALHAAISEDEGKTWRGYREVYLDPKRNDPPAKYGDRGTAYPHADETKDGKIVLVTGQAKGREAIIVFDPQWLYETHHEDDFSNGLTGWSVFKAFGPAIGGHWRNRTQAAVLINHPTRANAKVLHIRKPDEKAGDGAVWNFPSGKKGKLSLRIMLQKGFGGANIALADRFFNPTDDNGIQKAIFNLPIKNDGSLKEKTKLELGQWYTLQFEWDIEKKQCTVRVDDTQVMNLTQLNDTNAGVSYLRLRSTSEKVDMAGFLIESVKVNIAECK